MSEVEFKEQVDGKDVHFLVRSPSFKNQREGQKVYNLSLIHI